MLYRPAFAHQRYTAKMRESLVRALFIRFYHFRPDVPGDYFSSELHYMRGCKRLHEDPVLGLARSHRCRWHAGNHSSVIHWASLGRCGDLCYAGTNCGKSVDEQPLSII